MSGDTMDPFYTQIDENTFASSASTAGPWSPMAQHAGPPSALLTRAIERFEPREDHRLGRISIDILRPIPLAPLRITVRSIHTGKRTQLIEAIGSAADKDIVIARGWRLLITPNSMPSIPPLDRGGPAEIPAAEKLDLPWAFMGGYMSAIDWRNEVGRFDELGPAIVWARQTVPLVADENPSPWQRAVTLADSGSGVGLSVDPEQFPTINCDLLVALHREPVGEWIRLDSSMAVSTDAGAMAATQLNDCWGPLGTSTQTILASSNRSI